MSNLGEITGAEQSTGKGDASTEGGRVAFPKLFFKKKTNKRKGGGPFLLSGKGNHHNGQSHLIQWVGGGGKGNKIMGFIARG